MAKQRKNTIAGSTDALASRLADQLVRKNRAPRGHALALAHKRINEGERQLRRAEAEKLRADASTTCDRKEPLPRMDASRMSFDDGEEDA